MTLEDPVTSVINLLKTEIHVVKDDGSLASVCVSKEWYDRELLKNYDSQVTVGLGEARVKPLELSGQTRQRRIPIHVHVWSMSCDIKGKTADEILRVIQEKRKTPNVVEYDFYDLGPNKGDHKAFHAASDSEPDPGASDYTELSSADYDKIWSSDDSRYSKSQSENGKHSIMLFRFKIGSKGQVLKKIVLSFEGYGTAPGGNGTTIKAWNFNSEAWGDSQSGTGSGDETISITLTSNLANYVDSDGYVYLLARTTNPSDGTTPAVLYCDYALCEATVSGISYCDVSTFRDEDKVDVKPFVRHRPILLIAWLFETLGG